MSEKSRKTWRKHEGKPEILLKYRKMWNSKRACALVWRFLSALSLYAGLKIGKTYENPRKTFEKGKDLTVLLFMARPSCPSQFLPSFLTVFPSFKVSPNQVIHVTSILRGGLFSTNSESWENEENF